MPGRRVRTAAHAPLGGSRAAHHPPIGAPISPDWPATRSAAAHVADRSARGQPAIASSPAQGPPAPAPATPRQFPAGDLNARTLCRACACRVSSSWIWIFELKIGLEPSWSGTPAGGESGDGRPPQDRGDPKWNQGIERLLGWDPRESDGLRLEPPTGSPNTAGWIIAMSAGSTLPRKHRQRVAYVVALRDGQ